jgi:hypothetical protein
MQSKAEIRGSSTYQQNTADIGCNVSPRRLLK